MKRALHRRWAGIAGGTTALVLLGLSRLAWADEKGEFVAAFNAAIAAQTKANYSEAAQQYERALALAPKLYGENHNNTAVVLNNLAALYCQTAQFSKAEPLYKRCLSIYEANLGPDHPDLADSILNLANLYADTGQFAKAEPLYQRSLKIRETKFGPDHVSVAQSLNNLASLYMSMGQNTRAEPLFQRSLKIFESQLGPDHENVAESLNNLANLYCELAQYAKAETLYLRALKIREAKLGADHPEVAATLNGLAGLYLGMAQYGQAEPLFQRALRIYESKLGPDHPALAASVSNLATLYDKTCQDTKAEAFYLRALKIMEAQLGPDHLDVAQVRSNLAILYSEIGQAAKAEPLYLRSIKTYEAQPGPAQPKLAESKCGLAGLYLSQGKFTQAEPLFKDAMKIYEATLGPEHPTLASLGYHNLALLHAALKQPDDAANDLHRARQIVHRHVFHVLPMLASREQLDFLDRTDRKELHVAMTLGWQYSDRPAIAARSAEWLANGKAVAQETLTQQAQLERAIGNPQQRSLALQLQQVRAELSRLINSAPQPGREQTPGSEKAKLLEQEQELSKTLSRAGGVRALPPWVELDTIRQKLNKNSVLVDIFRFAPASFAFGGKQNDKEFLPPHYAAWIAPSAGEGDVKVVDLGEAQVIEAAVESFRTAFKPCQSGDKTVNPILAIGEKEAEVQLQATLAALAKLILEPLQSHLQDKSKVVISPDAALWLVPWGALPIGPDQYAIERWNIQYVISARDLLIEPRKAGSRHPCVFADADFDLPAEQITSALASLLGASAQAPDPANADPLRADNQNLSRSAQQIIRVPRLPGTASEAQAIRENLKTYAGEPRVVSGSQALEGAFKRLNSPRVLVMSTHGFFLPDQEEAVEGKALFTSAGERQANKSADKGKAGALENPLLRCGLLLAACNNREKIPANSKLDDGVLTGMEIVGANLAGTELVVLSACETGLGKVNNGEGVAGLRQAFQLAGAQAVVATLWQIPDVQSAQLMNDFFANLAAGQSKSDALRNAQLARIKARREKNGAAHPLFWAAFTLTGGN